VAGLKVPRQRGEQGHDAAAHERLAAGQAQLAHAARDERRAQPVQFLEREQIGLGQKVHVFRHAVDAAEVAAVGHRNAQIGDGTPEGVDQRRAHCSAIKVAALHAFHFHAVHRQAFPCSCR